MTNTTPRAGYPAPTGPGNNFPPLAHYQRNHMRIVPIDGNPTISWHYKAVISAQQGVQMTAKEAILSIGHAVNNNYEPEISLANLNNKTLVTEDELIEIEMDAHPIRHYYSHIHTNHATSTITFHFQLLSPHVDTYSDLRDPLSHLSVRFDNSLRFHLDEFLGQPSKLVGAILNTPPNQIHRAHLAREITINLPPNTNIDKPIIKASLINLTYTSDGRHLTTPVVGIFAPLKIDAEVSGTVKKFSKTKR